MSTSTETYTAVAGKAREATEKSVETFKQGVERFTDQANVFAKIPSVDLTQPVARYFEYVQKSVDLNRDLAIRWAELVTSLSGTVREQAEKVTDIVKDQTDVVADLTVKKAEDVANEQARLAEEAKKEQERQAKAAERAAAKQAKEEARKPYEGLAKAELSDLLAERELPKTGTVEELIERLVSADSE
jgi:hypothetical protein